MIARPLAGGQSLVPMLNLRLAPLNKLVDLGGIESLRRAEEHNGRIVYGALLPHSAFEDARVPDASNGLMNFVGGQIAYPGSELGKGYDQAMQSLVFDPLGMKDTTFDYAAAQTGDYAAPHGYDIDHVVRVMGMGLNDTIRASRPAGAAWSTVNDLLKYVQMEIRKGLLPDGTRYIGEAALLERRQPQIALGVDRDYAMALMVDKSDGVTIVDHGGDMDGFHSNMMWWPDQKVGAVILTNSDEGVMLRGPFKRRLNELMFDGEPQALATADANAKGSRASWDAQRKLIQYPADAAALATLAPRYHSDALGDIIVTKEGGKAWMDVGAFKSEIATSPQTMSPAATTRTARSRSLSMTTAMTAPNSTLVSRKVATMAIGAKVMAHSAMP